VINQLILTNKIKNTHGGYVLSLKLTFECYGLRWWGNSSGGCRLLQVLFSVLTC